ncbi:hypothetical protein ABID12_003374 [Martelella mangrovi]|uniref:Uncharacterized protein n=1 Tax=Martelella mangrovi TaxID=1397477 RepID=A0ABV2IES5_9HYPH
MTDGSETMRVCLIPQRAAGSGDFAGSFSKILNVDETAKLRAGGGLKLLAVLRDRRG